MEPAAIRTERRCGNTTRLADYYIQVLYNNHDSVIFILDHHEAGKHRRANEYLIDKIIKRLCNEHGFIFDKESADKVLFTKYKGITLEYDKAKQSLKLITNSNIKPVNRVSDFGC